MGKRKTSSLSGSLLAKKASGSGEGFVISLADKMQEAEEAADGKRVGRSEPLAALDTTDPEESGTDSGGDLEAVLSNLRGVFDDDETKPPGRRRHARGAAGRQPEPQNAAADLTSEHLIRALRQGQIAQAETIFGEMSGLGAGHVRRVLYGADGRNLAIACRALGIEQLQLVSIFILSRKLGLGEEAPSPHKLTRAVACFDQIDPEKARRTLNRWLSHSSE